MELTEAIDEKPAQELASSTASIDLFCDALWLEHGLAKNSLDAYRRDLRLFAEWLSKTRRHVDTATEADVNGYMAARRATRRRPRTAVSPCSGATTRGPARTSQADDPTLKLRSAKQAPRFPKTLNEAQVEALLHAPDVETVLGLRDRTMLELMYASGLRVTELVTLKTVEVGLNEASCA